MDNIRKAMQAHKRLSYILVLGLIIFINCFGFPVYNFVKEWPAVIAAGNIYNLVVSAAASGIGLGELFPERHYIFIALLTAGTACAGLACRFLLEYGEVSNAYNFTVPNIIFHLGTFIVLSSLGWLFIVKHVRSKV